MSTPPLATFYARAKAFFPAGAFFGGFVWDALTLGRAVTSLDLWMLLGYLVLAAALLVFMGRRGYLGGGPGDPQNAAPGTAIPEGSGLAAPGRAVSAPAMAGVEGAADSGNATGGKIASLRDWVRHDGPVFLLQFCFGSLFSALFILYFHSASYMPAFVLAAGLLALLVANEFLEGHYRRFTLTWALFGTCAVLYLNFAIPHLAGGIHPAWFYLSTAAGVGLAYAAKRLSPRAQGRFLPTLGVAAALSGLYSANAIPPVPLVKKNVAICRNLVRTGGVYTAEIEAPPMWAFWRATEIRVRQRPAEKIYCFSSVFAPKGLRCTLYHRWRFRDPDRGWIDASRIGFPIRGGRAEGFRGYTYKRNLAPGRWEVRLETEAGRVLGAIRFRCEPATDSLAIFKPLVLD